MAAWCHGAPGIAIGRAAIPPAVADASVESELEDAVTQSIGAPEGQYDHPCCGNLARAEAALLAGSTARRSEWLEHGRAIALAVADRVLAGGRLGMRGQGFHVGATVPGFFQGLAGIGYGLLRASSPSALPCVLALEPASPHHRLHISR
jgi:lantibiotic modifying enzyme